MPKKRFGAALLSLCLSLGLCVPAYAADAVRSGTCGAEGDNLTWTLDSEGTLTISGTGDMADAYYYSDWYGFRSDIRRAAVGDGVTSIGDCAFYGCSGLTAVDIPDSVAEIGGLAFEGCSGLTSVRVPESVTHIGSSAFKGCSGLASVDIPDSVTEIGDGAFEGCSGLASVTIPSGVSVIQDNAFHECNVLNTVYFGGTEEEWNLIRISETGNDALLKCADIHYDYAPPPALYAVTVTGSHAAESGAGDYEAGAAVTVRAGTWAGHTFTGWTLSGAALANQPDTSGTELTFTMPGGPVAAAANWKEEEAPPAPALPAVSAALDGSAVRLTVTGGKLPENVKILAALGGKKFAAALSGNYDAAKAEAVFPASLKKNDKLYFLAPDTLIPLAKPTELK